MKHIGSAVCISISVSCEVLLILDLFLGMSQWCSVSWIDPHFSKCFSAPSKLFPLRSKLTKYVERYFQLKGESSNHQRFVAVALILICVAVDLTHSAQVFKCHTVSGSLCLNVYISKQTVHLKYYVKYKYIPKTCRYRYNCIFFKCANILYFCQLIYFWGRIHI